MLKRLTFSNRSGHSSYFFLDLAATTKWLPLFSISRRVDTVLLRNRVQSSRRNEAVQTWLLGFGLSPIHSELRRWLLVDVWHLHHVILLPTLWRIYNIFQLELSPFQEHSLLDDDLLTFIWSSVDFSPKVAFLGFVLFCILVKVDFLAKIYTWLFFGLFNQFDVIYFTQLFSILWQIQVQINFCLLYHWLNAKTLTCL